MSAVSSGCTSRSAACNWADSLVRSNGILSASKKSLSFDEFASSFWDWNRSAYIKGKLLRGQQIGRSHAKNCASFVKHHVLPYFQARTLSSIKPLDLENWLLNMHERSGLQPKTINLTYMAFRTILKEAHRLGYIPFDPSKQVLKLAEFPKQRGVLSLKEVQLLFAQESIKTIWASDRKLYCANLLAASTGMREGEIQALKINHVHPDFIEILHSWEHGFGLKDAKWKSNRNVSIPKTVSDALFALITESPYREPDDLVFCGPSRTVPLHSKAFTNSLYAALKAIGITDEQRRDRNITFHSWRHFINSVMRGKIPDEKLRLLTGHRTFSMTEHYTHLLDDDYSEMRKLQENVFAVVS
jgi:integrase